MRVREQLAMVICNFNYTSAIVLHEKISGVMDLAIETLIASRMRRSYCSHNL